MSKKPLSTQAILAKGALLAVLRPKLAADAAMPDLNKILSGVTAKNWNARKPVIVGALKLKLAKDANMQDVIDLLDSLENGEADLATDAPDEDAKMDDEIAKDDDDEVAEDEDDKLGVAGVVAQLKALLEKLEKECAEPVAQDTPPPTEGTPPPPVASDEDDGKDDKGGEEDKVSKPAMDAAIATAVKEAEANTIARMNAIAQAENDVNPYVGKLAVAMDSAEQVYKTALETLGVDVSDMHPSAYKAVLKAQPKPGDTRSTMATDSAFSTRFPEATRIRAV